MEASPAPEARALMDEKTFRYNFNNLVNRGKTYLCHELERLEGDIWIPLDEFTGFLRNQGADMGPQRRHAEPIFLERMASWKLDKKHSYRVTCFISWSPCARCAKELAAFVRENRHMALRVFAARIHERSWGYEARLRALKAAGAQVTMMTSKEFEHCWETFVDHQGRPFPPWDHLDAQSERLSQRLEAILEVTGWREVTEAWREGYTRKPWIRNPMDRLYLDYFYFHFDNLPTPKYRNGCYICYQVEGTKNHSRIPLLRGVFENEFYPKKRRHTELCFLSWFRNEKTSLDKRLSPGEKYRVTWYISWSPCFECVDEVVKFLKKHRNVELSIFAARLYYSKKSEYRQGLRKLCDAGVQVAIMSHYDFEDCLNNFVFHQGRSFWPWNDLDKNSEYLSNMLEDILQNQED